MGVEFALVDWEVKEALYLDKCPWLKHARWPPKGVNRAWVLKRKETSPVSLHDAIEAVAALVGDRLVQVAVDPGTCESGDIYYDWDNWWEVDYSTPPGGPLECKPRDGAR